MNRREKQVQTLTTGKIGKGIFMKVCPVYKMHKAQLEGLSNICTMKSSIINPNHQTQLFGVLKGSGSLKYYYVRPNNWTKTPQALKFMHYKNELSKTEPNQIKILSLDGFKFFAYGIQFLETDGNGYYLIVHEKDIIKTINLFRNETRETPYQKRSREYDMEILEDVTGAYDIKSMTDSQKIFEHLDEYERKLLYTYAKKAGVGPQERKLLKEIHKGGGKTFECYLNELKDELKEIRSTPRPIEYHEHTELEARETELYDKIISLEEEDNSWNNFKTTLEDYNW